MVRRRPDESSAVEREAVSRELLRLIGTLDPYADADPDQVEARLRKMNYGATNSRVSKIRRGQSDAIADTGEAP